MGVTLTQRGTYTFGGYEWKTTEVFANYAVLQSTGVTSGSWPGYSMGNFSAGIAGQNISIYDTKLTDLYNSIKSAEYNKASYGTGLYLIPKSNVENRGSAYWSALMTAGDKHESLGASYHYVWLGDFNASGNQPYNLAPSGSVGSGGPGPERFVVAPAFNLDLSKVVLQGNALSVKPEPASMTSQQLITLKAKLKTELARRNGLGPASGAKWTPTKAFGSLSDYSSAAYDFTQQPIKDGRITVDQGKKTVDLLLKIKEYGDLEPVSNTKPIPKSFNAGLIEYVDTLAGHQFTGESTESNDCGSACSGLCVGSCIGMCNGCLGCTASCGSGCNGGCMTETT